MSTFNDFLPYYLAGLASLVFLSIVGILFLKLLRMDIADNYSLISIALLVGLILMVVSFAVVRTGGRTIMAGMIPVFIFFRLQWNPAGNRNSMHLWAIINVMLVGITIFSVLFFLKRYTLFPPDNLLAVPHPDDVFNSMVSVYLDQTGIENFSLDYFFSQSHPIQPYHYFELWMASAFAKIFGLKNLFVLTLNVHATLLTVIFLGVCGTMRALVPDCPAYLLIGCGIFGLIFMASFLPIYKSNSFLGSASTFTRNAINYPKLSVIYAFLSLSLQVSLLGQKKSAAAAVLFLPIVFISTAPAVLAGFSLLVFVEYWCSRSMRDLKLSLFTLLALALVFGYLYYWSGKSATVGSYHSGVFDQIIIDAKYLRVCFNIVVGAIIQFFVLYFLQAVLIVVYWRELWLLVVKNRLAIGVLGMAGLSLLSWAVLHNMPDSVQLFSNFTVSFINLSSCIALGYLFITEKIIWKKLLLAFVIVLSAGLSSNQLRSELLNNPVSDNCDSRSFYEEVSKNLGSQPFGVAFIRDRSEYNSIFVKNSAFNVPARYLLKMNDRVFYTSVSVFEIPIDVKSDLYPYEKRIVESAPFYKFVADQKRNGTFVELSRSMHDFIINFRIRCIVLSPLIKTPPEINGLKNLELINPCTRETLVFLK